MARLPFRSICFGLLCLFLITCPASAAEPERKTPIDRYVNKPDASYRWEIAKTIPGDGITTYVVDMVSQTWRTKQEVDRPQWRHWLIVVKPDKVTADKALLLIGGGRNGRSAPGGANEMTLLLAKTTGSVVAELQQVPNQPLVFNHDGEPRVEDNLIGYTWSKFMETGDDTWPARLPMVKSAVRAMDTIQALLSSDAGGNIDIKGFVIAGASKRGWTTWMTAAVDPRVVAIIPIVIDVLNAEKSMEHHHEAYGFWAPAVGDYVRHKILERRKTPEHRALMRIEDPFYYRDRLKMPKYIVNASGDEFFLPDSSKFYFDELRGEKYLRYVPNTRHSLGGSDAVQGIQAFYSSVLRGTERPKFSWKFEPDGSIVVQTQDHASKVLLWQATNSKARDFRLEKIGKAYKGTPLKDSGDGRYVAKVDMHHKGWTAFFVELTYKTDGPFPMKFTTAVRVLPDVLPFAEKTSE